MCEENAGKVRELVKELEYNLFLTEYMPSYREVYLSRAEEILAELEEMGVSHQEILETASELFRDSEDSYLRVQLFLMEMEEG